MPYQNLKSVKIIPVISGVRKESSLKVDFTTIYDPIVNYVDQNDNIGLNIDDFEIGIPLNEILSVNVFDLRVYNMFQEADPNQQEFNFE